MLRCDRHISRSWCLAPFLQPSERVMQWEQEWEVYTSFLLLAVLSPHSCGDNASCYGFNVNWFPFPILTALSITATWNWRAWWLTTISWQWPQRWKYTQFITCTTIRSLFSGNEKAQPPQRVHQHTYCVSRHSINANSVMFSHTTVFRTNPISWRIIYRGHGISLTFNFFSL